MGKKLTIKRRKVQTPVDSAELIKSSQQGNNSSNEESSDDQVSEKEQSDSEVEQESDAEDSEDSDASVELEDDDLLGDEEDDDDEEEEEDNEEVETGKKRKRPEKFAGAISAILNSRVKAHERDVPILIRSKKSARDLETSRLEAKAKRALTAEKKQQKDKDRVKDVIPQGEDASKALEYERELKQLAKRGVVRLFNAVLAAQNPQAKQSQESVIGLAKKEEHVNEMSKQKFLDLIKSGNSSSK